MPQTETVDVKPTEELKASQYPLDVVYCGKCGLPPEYCEFSPKSFDIEECKKWLKADHSQLYDELYP